MDKPVKPRGPGVPAAKGTPYQKPSLKAAEKKPTSVAQPDAPAEPKAKPKAKKEAPPAEE